MLYALMKNNVTYFYFQFVNAGSVQYIQYRILKSGGVYGTGPQRSVLLDLDPCIWDPE
jgi:hypothetical protein